MEGDTSNEKQKTEGTMTNEKKENEIFNEKNMEPILQITDMLTTDGQRELALDLLVQTIRRCELEAQGATESEQAQLDVLRAKLEEKYKRVYTAKRYASNMLFIHFVKTAITTGVILIALLIGGLIAGALIEGKLYALTDGKGLAGIYNRLAGLDNVQRIRLLGLLTQNPAVHYKFSVMKGERGNLKGAIEEMELALGLVEPDKRVYQERLRQLQEKYKLEKGKSKEETSVLQGE